MLRDHHMHEEFIGPRFLSTRPRSRCIRSTPTIASADLKKAHGIGYCNITKCCTKVCPEHITITDNAIIPLKERVVDEFYDPLGWLLRQAIRQVSEGGVVVFELEPAVAGGDSEARSRRRALPAAERAGAGREHLPGHPGGRAREPEGAGHLLLALTDQFEHGLAVKEAREMLPRLRDPTSGPTTRGSSASGRRRRGSGTAGRGRRLRRTNGCARRWGGTRRRSSCGRPATTTRSFAGTPARGCSIGIPVSPLRRESRWSRSSSRLGRRRFGGSRASRRVEARKAFL